MERERHDIVVTGLAAISSAGVGLAPLREALADGKSRLLPVSEEVLGESGHFWGRAKDFKATDFISPLKARKLDRGSQFAVVATGIVLVSAGIARDRYGPCRYFQIKRGG
jgi:3-oxoacyl-(acyl-carrier-protein) synthase